ncbi:molybdopterin-dependent oxidoreductase [Streptosporangiaceae bacterium NEAU-GS5]|nr:molybdopterin-dependent oxidoreductase [Streptosporangiaceae bacterium NEAU-GS5]
MTTTAYRTCPLCEAVCGLQLTIDQGRMVDVRGDHEDPFSRGFICPKGASLGSLDEDPNRLTTPLVNGKPATWAAAFAAVEAGLKDVPGPARAIYLGNPSVHNMGGSLYGGAVVRALGTRNVFSASTADQMPKHVSCGLMFGDPLAIPVPDLDRTDYLLMLGANPLESNGSLCTAPDFPGRLKALKKRGGRFVVVDPRRTRTAALADEHIFVRPGTDPYLLAGIAHTLFSESLVTVKVPVNGLDEVRAALAGFSPQTVAPVCGVPEDVIVRLAHELAAAPTAAVYGRIGTCTAEFGTVAQWLVDVLNVITGNLDRPGGAMFAMSATEGRPRRKPYAIGRWTSRVRGLPETNGELPVATLADEIETPGEGQVRALITVAGNPVMSAPNGPRLGEAFARLDFMVSVDPYLNETTRHAHVVLPPPRMLTAGHYDFALLTLAVRNYARYSPPILPLDGPSEGEILARLAMIASGQGADADPALLDELILGQLVTPEQRAQLNGANGAELRLDAMLRLGPYGDWNPSPRQGGTLSLKTLLDHPHGIDLGPLEPRIPDNLRTASGKVELAPEAIVSDLDRLRARLGGKAPEFVLIGRRHLRSNNSWLHGVGRLTGGTNRCTLQINPADVERLGLDGTAVVRSTAGELTVPLEPTDTIMPGVVSLPHGWSEASANVLTDDMVLDPVSGNAVFNGVPVLIGRPG